MTKKRTHLRYENQVNAEVFAEMMIDTDGNMEEEVTNSAQVSQK